MVFSSLVQFNVLIIAFRSRVLLYKILEIMEELTSLSNKIGFSYLHIVIKEYNPVLALIITYNRKRASNISIDNFKQVSSQFKLPFIKFLFYLSLDAWNIYIVIQRQVYSSRHCLESLQILLPQVTHSFMPDFMLCGNNCIGGQSQRQF